MLYRKLNSVNDNRTLKAERRDTLDWVVHESSYAEETFEFRIKLLEVGIYADF